MSSIPPPPRGQSDEAEPSSRLAKEGGPVRRPRYLAVALVAALVFGAGCWTEGCGRLAFYRGEREHQTNLVSSITSENDRARAESLYQRFIDVADASRDLAVPMAAATFVLGAALLALASRAFTGRANARSALMQVVAAQAIVVVASYFATREMWSAEADWHYEMAIMQQRDRAPPEQFERVASTLHTIRRWAPPGWLALRTAASVLILVALSRPRSREFFEAAEARASNP